MASDAFRYCFFSSRLILPHAAPADWRACWARTLSSALCSAPRLVLSLTLLLMLVAVCDEREEQVRQHRESEKRKITAERTMTLRQGYQGAHAAGHRHNVIVVPTASAATALPCCSALHLATLPLCTLGLILRCSGLTERCHHLVFCTTAAVGGTRFRGHGRRSIGSRSSDRLLLLLGRFRRRSLGAH